jgi:hypothetical protein
MRVPGVRDHPQLGVHVEVYGRGLHARPVDRVDLDAPRLDLPPDVDIGQDHARPPRETSTNRRRAADAAPESIVAAARSIPSASELAPPATSNAAPAFSRTTSARTGLASEHAQRDLRRCLRIAAAQILGARSCQAELRGIERGLGDPALSDVEDPRGTRRRELVQAIVPAEQLGAGPAAGKHLGHQREHPLVRPRPPARTAGPVRERSED